MIITTQDPAVMSEQERLSEIATILAEGYLRHLSRKENPNILDDQPENSAPCDHLVNAVEMDPDPLSEHEMEVA